MLSSPSESRLQVVFQFRALCFHLLQNLYTKNSFAKGVKNLLKKKKKRPEIVTNLFSLNCFHLLQNLYTKNSFAKGAKNHLKKKKKTGQKLSLIC